jgi:hypothetical protein
MRNETPEEKFERAFNVISTALVLAVVFAAVSNAIRIRTRR